EMAVDVVARAGVPADLASGVEIMNGAEADGAPKGFVANLRGRLLLASGDARGAEAAFAAAVAAGVETAEVAQPLRVARILSGRIRESVAGALEALPREAFEPCNLYAPRWERLRACGESADPRDARSLL